MGRVSGYTTRSGKRVSSYSRSGRANRKSRVLTVGGIGTQASMPKFKKKRSAGGARVGKAVGRFRPSSRNNYANAGSPNYPLRGRSKKKQSGPLRSTKVVPFGTPPKRTTKRVQPASRTNKSSLPRRSRVPSPAPSKEAANRATAKKNAQAMPHNQIARLQSQLSRLPQGNSNRTAAEQKLAMQLRKEIRRLRGGKS